MRIIHIKKSVFENNDLRAKKLREELKSRGTFLLNLMSSPGSGKTSTVLRTIERLSGDLKIGVLEADIDSCVDAETVAAAGVEVLQLHTGGMCHLDADMTRRGIEELGDKGFDLVILENIGNLICPADFDTGAARSAMILSVPEGDDKPLKYPLMFSKVDALIINKIDCMPYFDFDIKAVRERTLALNPGIAIFPISAKTGQGVDDWANWLKRQILNFKS